MALKKWCNFGKIKAALLMKLLTKFTLCVALFFGALLPLAAANMPAIQDVIINKFAYNSQASGEAMSNAEKQLAADPRKKSKKQKRRTPIDKKRKMKNGKNCPSF
jgi:hypothetical protein